MDPKQQAEHLFLNTETSQKDIAAQLGIDPKTLYRWMKQGRWRELKSATRRMPSVLVENIYEQLDDINYNIARRDRGDRHPSKDESLTISRLINSIGKVKKETTQGQNIEFMMNFIGWIQMQNDELAKELTGYGSAYLMAGRTKGFHPYDIEYGAESAPPYFQGGVPAEPSEAQAGGGGFPLAFPPSAARDTKQSHDHTDTRQVWPTDPNCPLPLPAATNSAPGINEIGHDSGIPLQLQLSAQSNDSQQNEAAAPAPSMPEMPENNLPQHRASTYPCEDCITPRIAPVKQAPVDTTDPGGRGKPADIAPPTAVVPAEGTVPLNDDLPPLGHTPATPPLPAATAYTPPTDEERADPQYFVKRHLRENGIDPDEKTQLYSIGEAIFTLKVPGDKRQKG